MMKDNIPDKIFIYKDDLENNLHEYTIEQQYFNKGNLTYIRADKIKKILKNAEWNGYMETVDKIQELLE